MSPVPSATTGAERPDGSSSRFSARCSPSAALEATLRLAEAQEAMLMPAYLAVVPEGALARGAAGSRVRGRAGDAGADRAAGAGEPRTRAGVEVDSRIERGRTARHALERLLEAERFDSLVLPARTSSSDGFAPDDVAWALDSAPGEVLVLRPDPGGR